MKNGQMPPGRAPLMLVYGNKEKIYVLLEGGTEDRDSEMAKSWAGTLEEYTFSEKNGVTDLSVSMTIYPQWEKMFNNDWPKALAALKDLCEESN
jgi:hypothetical protein